MCIKQANRPASLVAAALLAAALASPAPAARPADPFGLDRGEATDLQVFLDWLAKPAEAPKHPLVWLKAVTRSKKTQRKYQFAYFLRQTGLKGRAAELAVVMADDVFALDAIAVEAYRTESQQEDIRRRGERLKGLAGEFFSLVPRKDRVRVYKVAEKFEGARLILLDLDRLKQTEISDDWMNNLVATEKASRQGYLFGMLEGRTAATADRIVADFRTMLNFLLTFSKPPVGLKGKKLKSYLVRKKRVRSAILKRTVIFGF